MNDMKMWRFCFLFLLIPSSFPALAREEGVEGDSVIVNPEVLRAIRNGTFLNLDPAPAGWKRHALPITRDFSEYIQPDSLFPEESALEQRISPSLFLLMQIGEKDSRLKVREEAFRHLQERALLPASVVLVPRTPLTGKIGAFTLDDGKGRPRQGGAGIRVGINFSLDDILQYIFYEHVRNRKKNRRRAATWMYYNDYPTY